jgi:acylphosphatase
MNKDEKMVRAHLLISGRVQGVAFRYYAVNNAQNLGIRGWVRNCWDDRVEMVAEGEKDKIKELIDWCYQGPRSAVVEKVDIKWEEYKGEFSTFGIRF